MGIHKAGIALDLLLGRDRVDPLEHEADEAVAFTLDAGHHLATIDMDLALRMHPKAGGLVDVMDGFGGGNQQLGGHATDAGTGSAEWATFDQHHARGMGLGGTIGAEPGGSTTNHGDINLDLLHAHSLKLA